MPSGLPGRRAVVDACARACAVRARPRRGSGRSRRSRRRLRHAPARRLPRSCRRPGPAHAREQPRHCGVEDGADGSARPRTRAPTLGGGTPRRRRRARPRRGPTCNRRRPSAARRRSHRRAPPPRRARPPARRPASSRQRVSSSRPLPASLPGCARSSSPPADVNEQVGGFGGRPDRMQRRRESPGRVRGDRALVQSARQIDALLRAGKRSLDVAGPAVAAHGAVEEVPASACTLSKQPRCLDSVVEAARRPPPCGPASKAPSRASGR